MKREKEKNFVMLIILILFLLIRLVDSLDIGGGLGINVSVVPGNPGDLNPYNFSYEPMPEDLPGEDDFETEDKNQRQNNIQNQEQEDNQQNSGEGLVFFGDKKAILSDIEERKIISNTGLALLILNTLSLLLLFTLLLYLKKIKLGASSS